MATDSNIDYSLLHNNEGIQVLAVEDDLLSMTFLESQITELGHSILKAQDGQEALYVLEKHQGDIDVVLMDREMPIMNGLDAVKRIKNNPSLRNIPIVMVTSADTIDEMKQGLDAGVFYYLTKPVDEDMLRSVLSAAVREAKQSRTLSQELRKHRTSFDLIDTAKFKFQTLAEAESLSAFIANCFPDPERVLPGLGELLINAIEHGNLGIGYHQKTELIESRIWRSELERLQQLPQHKNKFATATVTDKDKGTYVVVEDEGDGFNWQDFMQIDPSRAGHNHGRGIAQANSISFDKITYNETGNQVVAFVGQGKSLEW